MKILLINNRSKLFSILRKKIRAIPNVKLDEVPYDKITNIKYDSYDGIILSGGSNVSSVNTGYDTTYAPQITLIKNRKKPILGICLGFQIVAKAYGEKIEKLAEKTKNPRDIICIKKDALFKNMSEQFVAYEYHLYAVLHVKNLVILAQSKDGIEAVKHPTKKIYGVQFHPECDISNSDAGKVLKNFITIVAQEKKKQSLL